VDLVEDCVEAPDHLFEFRELFRSGMLSATEHTHRTSPYGRDRTRHIGSDDPPGAVLALVVSVQGFA
jgi:hypothetical protein